MLSALTYARLPILKIIVVKHEKPFPAIFGVLDFLPVPGLGGLPIPPASAFGRALLLEPASMARERVSSVTAAHITAAFPSPPSSPV